jgi:hypothetical protein
MLWACPQQLPPTSAICHRLQPTGSKKKLANKQNKQRQNTKHSFPHMWWPRTTLAFIARFLDSGPRIRAATALPINSFCLCALLFRPRALLIALCTFPARSSPPGSNNAMPRFLFRRHAAATTLDDASSLAVVPSAPVRYGTSHTPAVVGGVPDATADGFGFAAANYSSAADRLHPSALHFERLVLGAKRGGALKADPYPDPRDADGDDRRSVSKAWDAPTALLFLGGRGGGRHAVSGESQRSDSQANTPRGAHQQQADASASPVSEADLVETPRDTARPLHRPRSAAIRADATPRKVPRQFPRPPPAADVEQDTTSQMAAPTSTTTAAIPHRPFSAPALRRPAAPTSMMERGVGRDAPMPGYFAANAAPSATTVAMAAAADYEAARNLLSHRAAHRGSGARVGSRTGAASAGGSSLNAVGGAGIHISRKVAIDRAMLKHGAPFAWLKKFDYAKSDPRLGNDPHVQSPRLGVGPFLYGRHGDNTQHKPRDADEALSPNRNDSSTAALTPQKRQTAAKVGYRERRGVSVDGRGPITAWHAGVRSDESRPGACIADMGRATSRAHEASRGTTEDGGRGPMPLSVLEAASQSNTRHVRGTSIAKQTPRPPLARPSASRGLSLFVKYGLVEPAVTTPRFASAVDNRPVIPKDR